MAELNRRIIVVDDEKGIVQAYVDSLAPPVASAPKQSSRSAPAAAPAGPASSPAYEILPAYSGAEALDLVRKNYQLGRRIAGGFFDVKMPGALDGLQAIQEIWKIDPCLHCTVVTAYNDRNVDDIDRLFGERFKDQWDYLNKPFTQAEIVQKARQMTAAWNRKRNLEDTLLRLQTTQNQLIRSEKMAVVGQLARAIGHEFGNLLQAIIGKADLASQESNPAKIQEKLQSILQAAQKASLIVRNLQSFSKTERTNSSVNLRALVKDTLLLVDHELKKHSVQVVDRTAEWAPVHANAGELEQILLNLIINAIHAMPQGGTIEIGGREEGDTMDLWVKDTGSGIRPEWLKLIFEYGFSTKGDQGSGLGLSISKQLAESHGGTLLAQSELGRGTVFTLRLPRSR